MHPNTFLKSLWRNQIFDQVFVAMDFSDKFKKRFDEVIKPAIEGEAIAGFRLKAFRVDNSKSGDSILTEISDGIAHSRIVLLDVSVVDEGRYSEKPIRNGNVMYEVGLALASRTPAEVLLVRDDNKGFLFDVSTIPHMWIDFNEPDEAIEKLREALEGRLKEVKLLEDARVQIAARALDRDALEVLSSLHVAKDHPISFRQQELAWEIPERCQRGLDALEKRNCIETVLVRERNHGVKYRLNEFGIALAEFVLTKFETLKNHIQKE